MVLKRTFFTTVFFLLCSSAFAAHLDLAWSPNSEYDLAGYIVYYGTSPGDYTDWMDAGNATSVRIRGLPANQEYFIALTAYDVYGNESDFSAEVSGDPLPGDDPAPPGGSGAVVGGSSSGGGCFLSPVLKSFFED